MKTLLIPFQLLALVGFTLAVYVHVMSLRGGRAFPGAELLHIGIFVVFLPAILVNLEGLRTSRSNRGGTWKILLRGCPVWMIRTTYGLFGYAIINFGIFIFATRGRKDFAMQGAMSPTVLRGFSGHWMLFYWASFAILYSRTHLNGPIKPRCLDCQTALSPLDHFCANCGRKT